jgi:hypothetical protein
MRQVCRVLVFFGVLGAVWRPATESHAQSSTTGAISGVVTDKETGKPLPGVTVVATSPQLQGSQAEITDERGAFKIDSLPPGAYLVTFYYSEIQLERSGVRVFIAQVTRVDQAIDLSQEGGEVITVEGKTPTIDVTRTDQGITVDKEYLKSVPVPGRTFASALGAAAGSANDSQGVGFSGSTSLENVYVIDGVNTTALKGAGIATPLLNEFIEELQVLSGGYNAEFGRATGGVVNVVTKSGSNEFHGSVFSTLRPFDRDRTPVVSEAESIDSDSNLDYSADFGLDLGGPIVKDKVWFYVGFAPQLLQSTVTRIVKRQQDCRTLLPDGSLSPCMLDENGVTVQGDRHPDVDPRTGFTLFEELDRSSFKTTRQSYQFVSKINYAVSPTHQGSLSMLGTPSSGEGLFTVRGTPAATRADFTSLNTDISAKWTSKFNDNATQLDLLVGWHRDKYDQDALNPSLNDLPTIRVRRSNLGRFAAAGQESNRVIAGCSDSGPHDPYPGIVNCPTPDYWLDSPGYILDSLEERRSAQATLTRRVRAIGHHELKGGVNIESNLTADLRNWNGGRAYFTYPEEQQNYTAVGRIADVFDREGELNTCGFERDEKGEVDVTRPRPCKYVDSVLVRGNTFNVAGFVQDSWTPDPSLTINYGLRYEEQRLRYADQVRGETDPFTNDELGKNALVLRNMWAPRLGIIYDWTKEGRSKVYGSVGRFYESIPMDINDAGFAGDASYTAYWINDRCNQGNAQWAVPEVGVIHPYNCPSDVTMTALPNGDNFSGGTTRIAPGTKAQYLDEAVLGVQYEVLEDLNLGVAFKRRTLGRVLEDLSVDGADSYIIGNPGTFDRDAEDELVREIAELDMEDPRRAQLTQRLTDYRALRNFDRPRRDHNAVEISAMKRFSRQFYVQSSYTLSSTRGNYPGLLNVDTGDSRANIGTQYDLVELLPNRDGALPQDKTHNFKLDGHYTWDFKEMGVMTAGTRVRAFSGAPQDVLAAHHRYGRGESYLLPRGAFGRTDFVSAADVHLSYGRKFASGYDVTAFVDIFNVFNQEQQATVEEEYTIDSANPVVGGEYEDLVYLKRNLETRDAKAGTVTSEPVTRFRNFANTTGRYAPQSIRLGLRVTF